MQKLLSVSFEKDSGFNRLKTKQWLINNCVHDKVIRVETQGPWITCFFTELEYMGCDQFERHPSTGVLMTYRKSKQEYMFDILCSIEEKEDLEIFYNNISYFL